MQDVVYEASQDRRTPGIFMHNAGSTERQKCVFGSSSVIENTSVKKDPRRKAKGAYLMSQVGRRVDEGAIEI